MAIRNVVVRGYGPGASIAFVVTRGYIVGIPTASIGGVTALTEPVVVADSHITTITLSNDTWVPSGSAFNQVRQIILNGVTSAQSEILGWNREVRDKESVTSVVRTSDTLVTITWSAAPDYDITGNEAITVTVPDEALITSTSPVVATPAIAVAADVAIQTQHILTFSSVSQSAKFSAVQQRTTFVSVSNTIEIVDIGDPLGFLLKEDGGILLQENDLPIALE